MKRIIKYLSILLIVLCSFTLRVNATTTSIYVNLESLEYSTNKKDYNSITEYKTM